MTETVTSRPKSIDVFAGTAVFLILVAFSPALYASFWSPRAALLLIIGAAGFPLLVYDAFHRDAAAGAAIAFLVVAGLSAALAADETIAVFGLYGWGTGLLYYVLLASVWAVGRRFSSDAGRRAIEGGALAGAAVNGGVALLQTAVDVDAWSISGAGDRAHGLMGNPVHLAALVTATLALVAWRWVTEVGRRGLLLGAAALFAAASQASGSRFALLGISAVLVALVAAARFRAAPLVIAIGFGLGVGALVPSAGEPGNTSGTSGTARAVADPGGGFVRLEYWKGAASAFPDEPILGYGPGHYRSATSPHRTSELVGAEGEDVLVADAHNVLVEVMVVTGLAGLTTFLVWLLLAVRRVRPGPLLAFGVVAFGFSLVQPLNLTTVPLGFLALGGCTIRSGLALHKRPVRIAQGALTAFALVAALLLLAGDYFRKEALLGFEVRDAKRSEQFLPAWSEPAEMLARVYTFHAVSDEPDDDALLDRALSWRLKAARRDRSDPHSWNVLAELEIYAGDLDSAYFHFLRALRWDPHSVRAMSGLAEVALRHGREGEAAEWYRQALVRTKDSRRAEFLRQRVQQLEQGPDA